MKRKTFTLSACWWPVPRWRAERAEGLTIVPTSPPMTTRNSSSIPSSRAIPSGSPETIHHGGYEGPQRKSIGASALFLWTFVSFVVKALDFADEATMPAQKPAVLLRPHPEQRP